MMVATPSAPLPERFFLLLLFLLSPSSSSSKFIFFSFFTSSRGKFYFIMNKSGVMVSFCDTFVRARWLHFVLLLWCSRIIIICYLINAFFARISLSIERPGSCLNFFVYVHVHNMYIFLSRAVQPTKFNCLLTRSLACFAFILFSNYGSIRWLFRNGGFQ